jgi:hypothetical protein
MTDQDGILSENRLLIEYDDDLERSKVTINLRRRWGVLVLFSIALIIWIAMLGLILTYLIRGSSSSIVLTILILVWLVTWLGFGRFLWKRWQHQAAGREILFVEKEQLIIRRPISILGITTAYDMEHVNPLYFSDKHKCPAFDYAYLHVYFGQDLRSHEAEELIKVINSLWFPEPDVVA